MKRIIILSALLLVAGVSMAQRKKSDAAPRQTPLVDSIAFHLYTDSLKKGTHNYINVDGRLPGGGWYPLGANDLIFESDEGHFEGNDLVIPADFKKEKVTITATYKRNTSIRKQVTVYIKILPDGPLKTKEEIMQEMQQSGRKKKGRS
jgi:hypothetical protein